MTDFFTQLARRTLTSQGLPRPAIAPLFASGPDLTSKSPLEVEQREGESKATQSISRSVPVVEFSERARGRMDERLQERGPDHASEARQPGKEPEHEARIVRPVPEHSQPVLPSSLEREDGELRPAQQPVAPLTVNVQLRRWARPEQHVERIEERQAAATPPVIKVSIGRVEVRAVVTPSPSPPRRVEQPARRSMLQAYLEERNRGKL